MDHNEVSRLVSVLKDIASEMKEITTVLVDMKEELVSIAYHIKKDDDA